MQFEHNSNSQSFPPGRIKIVDALRLLLENKEFNSITTNEIAKAAGVNEALIYKYFEDKRDLLHQVLGEYLEGFIAQTEVDLKGIKGSLNKLRKLFWSQINDYAKHRVFAKIVLLEVKNFPGYFYSDTYQQMKYYAKIVLKIIEEGVASGEIRDDISPWIIRQIIFGAIEHLCLPSIIFNREISPDTLTEGLCELLFDGIKK